MFEWDTLIFCDNLKSIGSSYQLVGWLVGWLAGWFVDEFFSFLRCFVAVCLFVCFLFIPYVVVHILVKPKCFSFSDWPRI